MDRKPQPTRKPALEVLREFMDKEGIDIRLMQPRVYHAEGELLVKIPNPAYQVVYIDDIPHGESN